MGKEGVVRYFVQMLTFSIVMSPSLTILIYGYMLFLIGKKTNSNKLRIYGLRLMVSVDQLVNVVFGGSVDETVSSRLGKDRDKNWLTRSISSFLDILDPGHVEKYVELDETDENL